MSHQPLVAASVASGALLVGQALELPELRASCEKVQMALGKWPGLVFFCFLFIFLFFLFVCSFFVCLFFFFHFFVLFCLFVVFVFLLVFSLFYFVFFWLFCPIDLMFLSLLLRLKSSELVKKTISTSLCVGNAMNRGTKRDGAKAIVLPDGLLK